VASLVVKISQPAVEHRVRLKDLQLGGLGRQAPGRGGLEGPASRYCLEVTMCTAALKAKKSGVLSLMFVHDAYIDNIEIKLLKDKL